jgi:hypothetical protein
MNRTSCDLESNNTTWTLSLSNVSALACKYMNHPTPRTRSRDLIVILLRGSVEDFVAEIETGSERRYPRITESIRAVLENVTSMSGSNPTEDLLTLIKTTCKDEIQTGFDKGFAKLIGDIKTEIRDLQPANAVSRTKYVLYLSTHIDSRPQRLGLASPESMKPLLN